MMPSCVLANFVGLSQDIFALEDAMDILDTTVELTVVGGATVYRAGGL